MFGGGTGWWPIASQAVFCVFYVTSYPPVLYCGNTVPVALQPRLGINGLLLVLDDQEQTQGQPFWRRSPFTDWKNTGAGVPTRKEATMKRFFSWIYSTFWDRPCKSDNWLTTSNALQCLKGCGEVSLQSTTGASSKNNYLDSVTSVQSSRFIGRGDKVEAGSASPLIPRFDSAIYYSTVCQIRCTSETADCSEVSLNCRECVPSISTLPAAAALAALSWRRDHFCELKMPV